MFLFYLLCFFFYKIGEQEDRTGSACLGGVGTGLAPMGLGEAVGM
jgi:hypothetical protein